MNLDSSINKHGLRDQVRFQAEFYRSHHPIHTDYGTLTTASLRVLRAQSTGNWTSKPVDLYPRFLVVLHDAMPAHGVTFSFNFPVQFLVDTRYIIMTFDRLKYRQHSTRHVAYLRRWTVA